MQLELLIVLIATLIHTSRAAYECDHVITEKIVAMTGVWTKDCSVYTESNKYEGWAWYKCTVRGHRIKDGVPRTLIVTTEQWQEPYEKARRLKPFLQKENLKLIDFFTIERGRMDFDRQSIMTTPELVATVTPGRRLNHIWMNYNTEQYNYQLELDLMNFPPQFDGKDGTRGDHFTGVERIGKYAFFSYNQSKVEHRIFVLKDSVPHVIPSERDVTNYSLPATNVEALIYLGKNIRGVELLGVVDQVTNSQIMKIYELSPEMVPTKIYDLRPIHAFIGCPQDMCLEGGIDSIYSLPRTADDPSIFITRGQFLFRIEKMGGKIKPHRAATRFENEYDADASFATFDSDTNNVFHFHVMDYEKNTIRVLNYHAENGYAKDGIKNDFTLDKDYLFQNFVPKEDKIFASIQINIFNQSLARLILFAGHKMYEFKFTGNRTNPVFSPIKSHLISERFDNIWTSFDATYKDPYQNYIYVFNRDYHVKYEWKEDGIMTPMAGPVLNQGTMWECDYKQLADEYKMFNKSYTNIEQYYEDIVRPHRFQSLPKPVTIVLPTTTTPEVTLKKKTTFKTSVWFYVIIALLIVIVILIIIALSYVWRRNKKRTASSGSLKKKKMYQVPKKAEPSFSSVTTTEIPTKMSSSEMVKPSKNKVSKNKIET